MTLAPANAGTPREARLRLFFACWPGADTAARLERWASTVARDTGGRVTRAATIHLTLAFLGEVAAARAEDAARAARRVAGVAHSFVLDEARCWPRNRIVWAGPSRTPAELEALAAALHAELRAEGFALETRPFAAHITLIRKARARHAVPALPPIEWRVAEFVLVRSALSAQGADYAVLERFALAAGSSR